MPSSSSYNNPSSLTVVVSSPPLSTLPVETRRNGLDQTLDQTNLTSHHHHQQPHLLLQPDRHRNDLNPDPDPAPAHQPANITTTTNTNANASSNSRIQSLPSHAPSTQPQPVINTATTTSTSTTSSCRVRYRECQKNHAASMGGHVVDGCGEFMPSGEEGTTEGLRCAACDCHRNFHRKETDSTGTDPQTSNYYYYARHNSTTSASAPAPHSSSVIRTHHQNQNQTPSILTMPPQHHPHHKSPIMMMTFGGGSGGRIVPPAAAAAAEYSSSEDLNHMYYGHGHGHGQGQTYSVTKKRFRTKFTQDQKEKMHEFAEKLDWKIQKQEEEEVQKFCDEVGVKRQVFKVWMHNNKQAAMKNKKQM